MENVYRVTFTHNHERVYWAINEADAVLQANDDKTGCSEYKVLSVQFLRVA